MQDFFPIQGFDHLELHVGNARQAAAFYESTFGFTRKAYRGLETGSRDVASHVLEQGEIRLVVTNALVPDHPVARSVLVHGDCVAVIGLRVPDAFRAFRAEFDRWKKDVQGTALVEHIPASWEEIHDVAAGETAVALIPTGALSLDL